MDTPPESRSNAFFILLLLVLLPPLICLLLLFTTDFYLTLGRALGANLPADESLVVYDAVCWQEGNVYRLNVVYWSKDSAPISATAAGRKSGAVTANPGINTLEIILREAETCPEAVTIADESRNRVAGSAVQEIPANE